MALEALTQYIKLQKNKAEQEVDKILSIPTKSPKIDGIAGAVTTENLLDTLKARTLALYKHQQDNIIKSELTRTDITKGIGAGENPYTLLTKAMECISDLTGDEPFYTVNKRLLQEMGKIK